MDSDSEGNGADIIDFATARKHEITTTADLTPEVPSVWVAPPTVLEAIIELVQRGDRVLLQLPHVSFTGTFVEVNADFATLRTVAGTEVHIRISVHGTSHPVPLLLRITDRIRSAAPDAPPRGQVDLRTLLESYAQSQTPVVMGTTLQSEQIGGHLSVGTDHVVVDTDGRSALIVPFDAISWLGVRNDRPAVR